MCIYKGALIVVLDEGKGLGECIRSLRFIFVAQMIPIKQNKNEKSNIQTVKFIRTFGSVVTGIVLIIFLFTDCDLTYRQEQIYKSFRGNVVLPFLYLYIHFTECL